MIYGIIAATAFVIGALASFVIVESRRISAKNARWAAEQIARKVEASQLSAAQSLEEGRKRIAEELESISKIRSALTQEKHQLEKDVNGHQTLIQAKLNEIETQKKIMLAGVEQQKQDLETRQREFNQRFATYSELVSQSKILKETILSLDVGLRKSQLDRNEQAKHLTLLDARSQELAEKYMAEVEKWVAQSITANNYAASKQRLVRVIEWCREIGYEVSAAKEESLLAQLKADFEEEVRKALQREEQARIKARLREDQLREKEIERELAQLDRERAAIQAALAKALADSKDSQSDEVERLKARLAEAEAKNQRAIAQAQLTKAGHIYVISNIGSFGEQVYKIGMTRRLEPLDRINELGDASVPFPFDVHMMISCENAPTLEHALHKHFHKRRINKVNPRKEYFKVSLDEIREFVEANHGEVRFTAEPDASQYRQSMTMSEQDQEYIEEVFESASNKLGLEDTEE